MLAYGSTVFPSSHLVSSSTHAGWALIPAGQRELKSDESTPKEDAAETKKVAPESFFRFLKKCFNFI